MFWHIFGKLAVQKLKGKENFEDEPRETASCMYNFV